MEPLGGRFDVRSGPNQGTRASLILPSTQEDVPLPRQTILPEQGSTVGMKPRDAGTTLRRLLSMTTRWFERVCAEYWTGMRIYKS